MDVPRPAWRTETGDLIDGQEVVDVSAVARRKRESSHPWADKWPTWIGL